MESLNDRYKRYEKRTTRYYTDKLGKEHIVFDYSKVKQQKTHEFKRKRKIGEHTITLPEPPVYHEIMNHDLPVEEQKFRRILPPDNFEYLPKDRQLAYMREDLHRRLNGLWFYNNGRVEYITGIHYFYLQWWKIDTGEYPAFRDSDRDIFYLWNYVENNDLIHGLTYITNRRSGKTWISTVILYEYASRHEDSICGIQSKTGDDAKMILRKLVSAWKKLPSWNKPTDSGDSNPQNELKFEEPSKRDSKGNKKTYKKVLNSSIQYGASSEEYFDGFKIKRYLCDEFGKNAKINVWRRWLIVKECLSVGSKILGKSFFTSTVEELEKGGAGAKKIWKTSSTKNLKGDGTTESGMIRIFKPAFYGLEGFIDPYGYSVVEDPEIPIVNLEGDILTRGAKTYLLTRRKGMDLDQLNSEKRKYPFSINEAFTATSTENVLPVAKIQQQLDFNDQQVKLPLRKGNFVWQNGERDTIVKWQDDPNGRWLVSMLPDEELRNKYTIKGGIRIPSNDLLYASGCDPYDHDFVADNRRSDACSYVLAKLDPMNPTISNFFVSEYLYRQKTSSLFYEDMIMQSVFFGCQMLIENNKPGCINYFKQRGMQGYLMKRPEITMTKYSKALDFGVPMSGQAMRESAIENLANYIQDWVGELNNENHGLGTKVMSNNYFERQLKQFLDFDITKWTQYDAVVASTLTILASKKNTRKSANTEQVDINRYYQKYKVNGTKSIRI